MKESRTMTTTTQNGLAPSSCLIGPVGELMRRHIRDMALRHDVVLRESSGFLTSTFRLSGKLRDVDAMRAEYAALAERLRREDHAEYVDGMEKAEKRRAWWGRLIGRDVRRDDMTIDESLDAADLIGTVMMGCRGTDEALDRLKRSAASIQTSLKARSLAVHGDAILSTFVSMSIRYLQHDIRSGDIVVRSDLKKRLMAVRPTIDTWDDGE